MTHRMMRSAAIVVTTMLAACSQGQNAPSAAPEAPVYGTTTGELACDEYLALAKSCVDKGRLGPVAQRRNELVVVERTLRNVVGGAALSLDRNAVWTSALGVARQHKLASRVKTVDLEKRDAIIDALPSAELCKHAVDQLPTDCQ